MLQAEISYLSAYGELLEQWSHFAVDNYPRPTNAPGKTDDAFRWAGSRFLAVPEIAYDPEKQPYPQEHFALLLRIIRPLNPAQGSLTFTPNSINILGGTITNIAVAQYEDQRITIQRPFTTRTELFSREELPQLGSIARAVLRNPETFALINTGVPDPGQNPAVIQRVIETISSKSVSPEHARKILSEILKD